MAVDRGKGGQLKKGSILNPGGRPKGYPGFRQRCQDFMEEKGWKELSKMAQGEGKTKQAALELIAGYAYGRPHQGIDVNVPKDMILQVINYAGSAPSQLSTPPLSTAVPGCDGLREGQGGSGLASSSRKG